MQQDAKVLLERSIFDQNLHLAFPPVVVKLLHALLEPEPVFDKISHFLAMDPVLSSTVLSIVNSPIYGFTTKITDINKAVMALGTREVFKLVIVLLVQKQMRSVLKRSMEYTFGDWRMTMWSAIAAEEIALRIAPEAASEVYAAAILKDIPLLLLQASDALVPVSNRYYTLPYPNSDSRERDSLGATHQELAGDMLTSWGMPLPFIELVRSHHDLSYFADLSRAEQCLALATRWAELLHGGLDDAAGLMTFEVSLRDIVWLGDDEFDKVRSVCAQRFSTFLSQLGIAEGPINIRFYEHSLSTLTRIYFLSLELEGAVKGVEDLGLILCKQFKYYLGITSCEFALRVPNDDEHMFFRIDDGTLNPKSGVQAPLAHLPWSDYGSEFRFARNGEEYGILKIANPKKYTDAVGVLPIFMQFVSVILSHYYAEKVEAGQKDNWFERLPVGLAVIADDGVFVQTNRAFLNLFGLVEGLSGEHIRKFFPFANDAAVTWEAFVNGDQRCKDQPLELSLAAAKNTCAVSRSHFYLRRFENQAHSFWLLVERLGAHTLPRQGALRNFTVLLLAENWTIHWMGGALQELNGKNFFEALSPPHNFAGKWDEELFQTSEAVLSFDTLYARPDGTADNYTFELTKNTLRKRVLLLVGGLRTYP